MPEGVKDEPNAYVATAFDSEPALPGRPRALGTPREDRLVRDPEANALEIDASHADAQLAIIQAVGSDARCPPCVTSAFLDEAELELGLGHAAHGRTLLVRAQRRAKATHAGNFVARTTRLLSK
jgi:hypothetical protein